MGKTAIFPASGALGNSVKIHLLKLLSPSDMILVSRDPSKNAHTGATTRAADYNEPSTLTHAFDGATTLMLVSYPSIEHGHRFKCHKTAIDAARARGIKHIFYSSLAFAGADGRKSASYVMQAHLDTEAYLMELAKEDAAFSFTSIRMGIYAESWMMYVGFPNMSKAGKQEVCIPHDGQGRGVCWVKRDELGEATARMIEQYVRKPEEFRSRNEVVLLSGPREWSVSETLEVVSRLSGKEISIGEGSIEQYVSQPQVQSKLGSHGPGRVPDQWVMTYEALRNGETSVVSTLLAELLGREPEDFETTLRSLLKE